MALKRKSEIEKGMKNMKKLKQQANPSSMTQQAIRTGGWANPSRGGELKFIDTLYSPDLPLFMAGVSTFNAAPSLLNGLVPGSAANQRIGRKVVMKSILLRWSFQLGVTSVSGGCGRILVVYDKQANAAAPTAGDVLLLDDFRSPNNLSNRDRFVTLFDQIVGPISVQGDFETAGTLYKRINLETMFNAGTAGTIGDITSGSVYLFAAQSGGVTTEQPKMRIRARIRYEDN